MNNFPILAGNEPRFTGVCMLPRRLTHVSLEPIFTLEWLREQNVVMGHKYEFDPMLVLRKERSYTQCSVIQIRWMLYAFPFGLRFTQVSSSDVALQVFREMYALHKDKYTLIYMNLGDVDDLTPDNYKEISSHFRW